MAIGLYDLKISFVFVFEKIDIFKLENLKVFARLADRKGFCWQFVLSTKNRLAANVLMVLIWNGFWHPELIMVLNDISIEQLSVNYYNSTYF